MHVWFYSATSNSLWNLQIYDHIVLSSKGNQKHSRVGWSSASVNAQLLMVKYVKRRSYFWWLLLVLARAVFWGRVAPQVDLDPNHLRSHISPLTPCTSSACCDIYMSHGSPTVASLLKLTLALPSLSRLNTQSNQSESYLSNEKCQKNTVNLVGDP